MPIASLRMESTMARIGISVQKPVQEIQQPHADLQLRQRPAILQIRQDPGEITIDSSRARYSLGLRTPMQFSDDNAAFGKQQWLEAIARISQEGDQLRAIEYPQDPIPEQAADKIGITPTPLPAPLYPDEGVDIGFRHGVVEIRIQKQGFENHTQIRPPVLKYTPGKAQVYMQQYNRLQIEVVGLQVDRLM
ncbi:DUF6470 family protein [Brevibacillus thermoruber]|jgi:hypothetical protein|uniref:DUF6470 family protein n=1 Tax=Brevibacillus thermoruber TaxID=33942 RepID=A0A9X3TPG2_9BACL|nr:MULTISPECIES: DUF6470 family protein [Brevibacillus]MDA5108075.1 DUF6470 family protein [Brevibacillus thermoruber]UYZ13998.1 DUF6470 family protein [Brevibacillus sp. WF146]